MSPRSIRSLVALLLAPCLLCLAQPFALAASPPSTTAAGAPSSTAAAGAATQPIASATGQAYFTDILGNFAAPAITLLGEDGIIPVPADRLFHPNAPVTRLDFALWAARALELPPPAHPVTFTDESQIPQADQSLVSAAAAAKLVQGYPDGSFGPTNDITRAELTTVLGRVLEAKGQTPQARYAELFVDGSTIPSWAVPGLLLVQDNLIYGEPCSPEACFAPNKPTTRAEAAEILVRFMQYLSTNYHQPPLPKPTLTEPFTMGMWFSDSQTGYQQLLLHGASLNELIYGGYDIQSGGQLVGFDSPRTTAWAAQNPQTQLWVMVQANSLSFLASSSQQVALISQVVAMVRRAGYVGVNFDVEGIPVSEGPAYTAFITEAAAQLHAIGAKISVAVPAETGSYASAFNYAALGQVCDQVVMMAYDYHYPGHAAGPIAPISWDQAAITYAKSQMPAAKVILGVPQYGYIWNTRTDGALGYWESGMYNEAAANGASIQWVGGGTDEATFSYTVNGTPYVGWFVDGQGIAARLDLARQEGIGGVVGWRLDYPTPDWWSIWAQDLVNWR